MRPAEDVFRSICCILFCVYRIVLVWSHLLKYSYSVILVINRHKMCSDYKCLILRKFTRKFRVKKVLLQYLMQFFSPKGLFSRENWKKGKPLNIGLLRACWQFVFSTTLDIFIWGLHISSLKFEPEKMFNQLFNSAFCFAKFIEENILIERHIFSLFPLTN